MESVGDVRIAVPLRRGLQLPTLWSGYVPARSNDLDGTHRAPDPSLTQTVLGSQSEQDLSPVFREPLPCQADQR